MNIKDDYGHFLTDNMLEDLENKLTKVYDDCFKETKKELDRIEAILSQYNDNMTEMDRLRLWRKKDRLNSMLDSLTDDIKAANKVATDMINGNALNVYQTNYNYGYFFLETESGYSLDFRLYNQDIFKKLLAENVNPFEKIALKEFEDKKRIHRELRNAFLQSIRTGESIQDIAKRIGKIVNRNKSDSIRIARTETTRLESIGREEVFKRGESLGLQLKKVWISTTDARTRESHLLMNLKSVDMDKLFPNGLKYPGDYSGEAAEVINCRCSHVVEIQGIEKSANLKKLDESIRNQTYNEWLRRKENGNRK